MSSISAADSRRQTVERLAEQVRCFESPRIDPAGIVRTGCTALDRLLPQRGFRRGALIEWIAAVQGGVATTLALVAAREACGAAGHWAVIDPAETFYPPAAQAWGLPLDRLVLVRPGRADEARWATDQALRCPGLAAVVAWPETLDPHTFRRWQLAAEQSGAIGLLLRPPPARREPTWADLRFGVEPRPSGAGCPRVRVEVWHARGPGRGRSLELLIDHETHHLSACGPESSLAGGAACGVPVVPRVAAPAPACRVAGG
ncbi:MAG: hypothetical protein K1X74_09705 [Pirellulales bacterium]|nr:hypothetical protein [Pirellulales bacterium]